MLEGITLKKTWNDKLSEKHRKKNCLDLFKYKSIRLYAYAAAAVEMTIYAIYYFNVFIIN